MGDKADLEDESSTDIQVDLISAFLNLDLTARSAPFGFQPTDPNPLNLFLPLIARVASARSLLKNVRGDGASAWGSGIPDLERSQSLWLAGTRCDGPMRTTGTIDVSSHIP